jgi:CheY-like chemotaxis protein
LLLVEDHADTANVLARMLRQAGYEVTLAHTVAQALDAMKTSSLLTAGELSRPVEVVVSDLGLPDGTGLELMQQLRAEYEVQGIALSGFGMDEDVRRAKEAGFARHLTKPVDFSSLLAALREL